MSREKVFGDDFNNQIQEYLLEKEVIELQKRLEKLRKDRIKRKIA